MNITTATATEEMKAVMSDYGITPRQTDWTLNERNNNIERVANHARTRRQARAMWLETFADFISDLRTTDQAIMTAESTFLQA